MMGLLEATAGSVAIDGQLLCSQNRRAWQARVAHVPQVIFLADASIAENIAFGVELSKIDPDKKSNSVTREERLSFVKLLKDIPIRVDKLLGTDKAIISSGGVILDEVDFKTMQSRKFSNLYLVGDILNIDRPSGGYSLQLCWTTGFVAGTHSIK